MMVQKKKIEDLEKITTNIYNFVLTVENKFKNLIKEIQNIKSYEDNHSGFVKCLYIGDNLKLYKGHIEIKTIYKNGDVLENANYKQILINKFINKSNVNDNFIIIDNNNISLEINIMQHLFKMSNNNILINQLNSKECINKYIILKSEPRKYNHNNIEYKKIENNEIVKFINIHGRIPTDADYLNNKLNNELIIFIENNASYILPSIFDYLKNNQSLFYKFYKYVDKFIKKPNFYISNILAPFDFLKKQYINEYENFIFNDYKKIINYSCIFKTYSDYKFNLLKKIINKNMIHINAYQHLPKVEIENDKLKNKQFEKYVDNNCDIYKYHLLFCDIYDINYNWTLNFILYKKQIMMPTIVKFIKNANIDNIYNYLNYNLNIIDVSQIINLTDILDILIELNIQYEFSSITELINNPDKYESYNISYV